MPDRSDFTQSRWFRLAGASLGILVPLVWLLTVSTPSEEAVKIRNALVLEMGQPADFDWVPGQEPVTFLRNSVGASADFVEAASKAGLIQAQGSAAPFESALTISRVLMGTAPRTEGPIQSDNLSALHGIIDERRGYCADFTQVLMASAIASGIPVREWSISFSAFGAGHAFTEIYDARRGHWILVDSFHSLYFVDPASNEPMSVRQVHDSLLSLPGGTAIAIVKIVPERFPFRSESLALDYYRRGMPQLAMTWGVNVFDYERSTSVRLTGKVPRSVEEIVGIITGAYPKSKIYPDGVSDRDVRELSRARNRFLWAALALVVSFAVFGLQIVAVLRRKSDAQPGAKVRAA